MFSLRVQGINSEDLGGIDLSLFTKYVLEIQCDTMSSESEAMGKRDADMSQD